MGRPIFLLTDFGWKDYYVAAMKAVILSINPEAEIIDITHDVARWNISQGGFIIWQITPYLPDRSIVVGVVDPGVGTERRNIIIETKHYFFIGPDNGLLYPAACRDEVKHIYEINIKSRFFRNLSYTFHGRDIYAPTAAYLSKEIVIEEIAYQIDTDEIVKHAWPTPKWEEKKVTAYVLHIDRFGNIITNIPEKDYNMKIRGRVDRLEFRGREYLIEEVRTFGELERGRLGIIIGSSGMTEIVSNMKMASKMLRDVNLGDELVIHLR